MIKLLLLFKKPLDTEGFMHYYRQSFTPLAKKLPKLKALDSNRVKGEILGGEPTYYLICELHFATKEAFKGAINSPIYRELGSSISVFAKGLVTILVTQSDNPVAYAQTEQLSDFEELIL